MKETSYWELFSGSGRVEDYLNFKQREQHLNQMEQAEEACEGVEPYAGDCKRNRHDFEDGAYRGI